MKVGRRLFLAFFVLAILARLIRIFMPRRSAPHSTPPPRYLEGDVVNVDVNHKVLLIHSGVGRDAKDLPIAVGSTGVSIRYGAQELSLAEVSIGDHATVRLRPPEDGDGDDGDGANAESVVIARAGGGG